MIRNLKISLLILIFAGSAVFFISCTDTKITEILVEDDMNSEGNITASGEAIIDSTKTDKFGKPLAETFDVWDDENFPLLAMVKDSVEIQTWQDAYAELLRGLGGKEFFLCDIDEDGIPELLTGRSTDKYADKYAEYDVHIYKNGTIECIGVVSTLSWSCLWLDNNGGILGYAYGAGAGGTYRYYIDNGVLCYDDEIYGYYFDGDGNQVEWFRGPDGGKVIVTEETEDEYHRIWSSDIVLESYDITEVNITKVIYGGI